MVELTGSDGAVHMHEVSTGGANTAECSPRTVGLTHADGKRTLGALQGHLVRARTEEYCGQRRRCSHCGTRRPLKDVRTRRLLSVFGTVEVRAPRFSPCRCALTNRRILNPAATIMPDRCTPEYERLVAKMGAWFPYRRARTVLAGFLPPDDIPSVETARQRTLVVGGRLEREAAAAPIDAPRVEARSIALSIDGGHVRSIRGYQMRSFEILLAQVSNDHGKHVVFSGMPAEADRQRDQLRGVLHRLGATSATPVTVLSDGAEGPRAPGEAASAGPTHHVPDWFHLSMRIQHVDQAVKSWPHATASNRKAGVRLAGIVERIRWRLWHGQIRRGLDLIGETLTMLETTGKAAIPAARKITRLLRGLETYVSGQSEIIIDTRRPGGVKSRSRRRPPRARCNGCRTAG